MVAVRLDDVVLAAAVYVMFAGPVPLPLPCASVSHVALLTAVHAHVGPVDTATVADPPADTIWRDPGVSVYVQGPPPHPA